MKSFPSPLASRVALGLTLLLLAGCASARYTADTGVSSPPPPAVGSTPIAAYDNYARAVAPPEKARPAAVAQSGPP